MSINVGDHEEGLAILKVLEHSKLTENTSDHWKEEGNRINELCRLAHEMGIVVPAPETHVALNQFDEAQHPRDGHGRFTDGGGDAEQSPVPYAPHPSGEFDSMEAHTKDGKWTEERAKVHKEIIGKQFEGKTPVAQPVAYVMGGGPAAGKSTTIRGLGVPENTVHVAPDDLLPQLPEYNTLLTNKDPNAGNYGYRETSNIGRVICTKAAQDKYNILVDGIGNNSVEALKAHADVLRQNGRKVVAHYVTVDTEEAVQRSNERGKATGRYVPESAIRELHASVSRIVPEAIKAGVWDEFTLHDNSGAKAVKVASAVGGKLTVHDEAKWKAFVAKGLAVHNSLWPRWIKMTWNAAKPIGSNRMIEIMQQMLGGKQPELKSTEESNFAQAFKRDMDKAKSEGRVLDIPYELLG